MVGSAQHGRRRASGALALTASVLLGCGIAVDDAVGPTADAGTDAEPAEDDSSPATTVDPEDVEDVEETSTDVAVTVSATVEDGAVTAEGTATVPDGALLAFELRHDETFEVIDGYTEVQDGTYTFSQDLGDWPAGDVEVWVAFQTELVGAEQPAEVRERYGENGEGMTGDQVTTDGYVTRVDATDTVHLD
ncbi:hypothetical protein [Egicoccus sp. AB-alg6-2]|uniref:hypothetical protein n=1 Tax=Egicoccus sp. AB-alg6-2 TaxID=3242692 RepID=UPI00359D98E6